MVVFFTTNIAKDANVCGWAWVTLLAVVTLRSALRVGEWWIELWGIQSTERLVDYGQVFDHERCERRERCWVVPRVA